MAYPKSMLNQGEEIVLDRNPSWTFLLGPIGLAVLGLAVFLIFMVIAPGFWWAGLAIFVLSALGLLANIIRWRFIEFVVTTDRIITRRGVVAKAGTEIPLDRVMNVSYRQSVKERILGVGDLVIESAGENGQQFFSDVHNPVKVQNIIYRQTEIYTQHGPNDGLGDELTQQQDNEKDAPAKESRSDSIPEQISQLDKLRQQGILTDEEFRDKKRQLLDRL